jgi:chromosomal replication initiation ATPase DnaA
VSGYVTNGSPLSRKIEEMRRAEEARLVREKAEQKARERERLLQLSREVSDAKELAAKGIDLTANDAPKPSRKVAVSIIKEVAEKHGISVADIIGPNRHKNLVSARHEAIGIVAATHWHYSLPQLGRLFGGRDHTTIMHAICRRVVETQTPLRGWSVEEAERRISRIRTNNQVAIVRYNRGNWSIEARP